MIISLIAAIDRNRGIGCDNALPWAGKVPRDKKRFRELTLDHTVIMGRKTFESIHKPLQGRNNIVVSGNREWWKRGVITCDSLEHALRRVLASEEVFIIGGASLYAQALPIAQRMYLTEIDGEFACDTFFPEYNPLEWRQASLAVHHAEGRNAYKMRFLNLERKTAP